MSWLQILQCKANRRWLLGYFLVFCLGITIAVRQPAFYMPDEGAHYLRAYEVSHLKLINTRADTGVEMPCREYLAAATKEYNPIANIQKIAVERQSDPNCKVRSINTAGTASFVAYIPAAFALITTEKLGWHVENRLIAARAINFSAWFSILFLSLLFIDRGRMLVACLILMPSVFWQLVALSADGATLTFCAAYVLWVVRIGQPGQVFTPSAYKTLVLLALLVGASKGNYAPITLLSFALWDRLPGKGRFYKLVALGLPAMASLTIFILLTGFSDPSLVYLTEGANPTSQIAHLLQHPVGFAQMIVQAISKAEIVRVVAPAYAVPNAGRGFGLMVMAFLTTGLLLVYSSFGVKTRFRVIAILVLCITLASLCLPLYLTYTPVGADHILGMQERYYLPLIPLIFIAVGPNLSAVNSDRSKLQAKWQRRPQFLIWLGQRVQWIVIIPLLGLILAVVNIPSTVVRLF